MAAPRFLRLVAFTALFGFSILPEVRAGELDGFAATLSDVQRVSSGINLLAADEVATLDGFVTDDLGRARQLRVTALPGAFSHRLSAPQRERAGLEKLNVTQLGQLDELVAFAIASQPLPKERPRLKDNEVVRLKRRLEVHGGFSLTLGWASGGRNFREAAGWVTYYDPKTGFGLGLALSQASGDFPYGYFYPYDYGYGYPARGISNFSEPFFGHDAFHPRGRSFTGPPEVRAPRGNFIRPF